MFDAGGGVFADANVEEDGCNDKETEEEELDEETDNDKVFTEFPFVLVALRTTHYTTT